MQTKKNHKLLKYAPPKTKGRRFKLIYNRLEKWELGIDYLLAQDVDTGV